MINLIFSPQWFYGKDIVIDCVSMLVLLFISYFAWQFYKLNKGRKGHILLAVSFLLMAIAFLFKMLTNFTLYFIESEKKTVGSLILTFQEVHYSDSLFLYGTIAYRLLTILGLYLLYSIYYKKQEKSAVFLFIYLFFISVYFTWSAYYIFHLTALLLLCFIVARLYYNCRMNRDLPARWLLISFVTIGLSELFFIFERLAPILYVVAEGIQLVGYVSLLIAFLMVLSYGKKKVKS